MYKSILSLALFYITCCIPAVSEKYDIHVDFKKPVNSHFIGNGIQWSCYPHADTEAAEWGALMTPKKWKMVYDRLDYIKPGIARVMDEAGWRYYKGIDEKGNPIIDFNTDEVKALFNILNYCQNNNIVVVFGEWGAPGFWGEPGNICRADDARWIHMITRYLNFLINEKGYTCIKYYNLVNEPNGYWSSTNGDWEQWKNGILMLHDSIRTIGLEGRLQIAGPDAVTVYDNPSSKYKGIEWVNETISQLNFSIGIYDVHAYPDGDFVHSGEFGRYYGDIAGKVKSTGKKIILGELGLKYSGELFKKNKELAEADPNASKDDSNMFVYSFFYGLDVVDALIQAMNNGLEGAVAWDLDDAMHTQGDKGNKNQLKRWGMWNSLGTELCNKPEDENLRPWFYTWSLMCRYFPSGMSIAGIKVPDKCQLRAVAGTIKGKFSVAVLNNSDNDRTFSIEGTGIPGTGRLNMYLYQDGHCAKDNNGFPIPVKTIRGKDMSSAIDIPAKSFILLTNMNK